MQLVKLTREHFAEGRAHLRQAEQRVLRQEELVARLAAEGQATAEALLVLRVLRETLVTMRAHLELEGRLASGRTP